MLLPHPDHSETIHFQQDVARLEALLGASRQVHGALELEDVLHGTLGIAVPLGVDAGGRWTEIFVKLEPGDRILWVSDGVIEAGNGKRDLLGFERVHELAHRSAAENCMRVAVVWGGRRHYGRLCYAPAGRSVCGLA